MGRRRRQPVVAPRVPASPDAAFLLSVVENNERSNHHGITDKDLSVCFKMSALCGYGSPQGDERPYSARRFKAALAELEASRKVTKRGERWYTSTSPGLRGAEDEQGVRRCSRTGCGADINHLRTGSQYCSDRCRNREWRKRGRDREGDAYLALQAPWSKEA
jgi:hypothetical protein